MEDLKNENRRYIRANVGQDPFGMHNSGPYNFRMHSLLNSSRDDSVNSIVTRLQMPPGEILKPLFDITPDIYAYLVPKIRLFRVNASDYGLKEIEFCFDKVEDKQRIDQLLNTQFDRGNSYGIKSFNFSFEGTTPATSRNDIKAELSLYFQSFQDLIKVRNHGQGDYKIVDLIVFPVNNANRVGTRTIRAEEYDPSYYRIRADVGWSVPESNQELNRALSKRGYTLQDLKNAILKTNKSFYLNMVDHDMSIKEDGSVEMNINYRAYVETALKSVSYDALASRTISRNRQKFKQALALAILKGNCNQEEIKTIKGLIQKAEEEMVANTYRSIIKRLNERNKIFFVDVDERDIRDFREYGFFDARRPPQLLAVNSGGVVGQGNVVEEAVEREAAQAATPDNPATLNLLKDGIEEYSREDTKAGNRINFFYMGDLIYTILDSVYEEDGSFKKGIEKTKFLLGSFDYPDPNNREAVLEFNIIDIPISVEYFYEWFVDNVIKKKRLVYPVMDFIRDITNDLIISLLFDACGRKPLDTKMRFNTGTFLALGKGPNYDHDAFIDYSQAARSEPHYPVIDVAAHYGVEGGLPFLTDKEGTANINEFYNYVIVYPVKTSAFYGGTGNYEVDSKRGVHHFQIGSIRGMLKKINFAKTDMQYIREARFLRNGIDGLLQLSAVYKTTLDMVGNTAFYPGMEIYIDAVGIGGMDFRSNIKGSLANILGFGGYHMITRVNSSIAPGKFNTTVEAQWFHSGAPGERPLGPERSQTTQQEENIENKPAISLNVNDHSTNCSPLVNSFESFLETISSNPTEEIDFVPNIESLPYQDPIAATVEEEFAVTNQTLPDGNVDVDALFEEITGQSTPEE